MSLQGIVRQLAPCGGAPRRAPAPGLNARDKARRGGIDETKRGGAPISFTRSIQMPSAWRNGRFIAHFSVVKTLRAATMGEEMGK